eukprot:CAMPEP_0202960536 /NCGR_PEP_ID=MMETSP1396-20130829/4690_1 /ASSEMBLY_ACC=CAM_ASM_000872 /TAXON_ID= /ORGANISM="Pseudokeronopsis sp., Strain Brazil" /LENGTH=111 /DNA_ID=CAMNT_0049679817 /DNA_START=97 /DNA_END=432 /DNA_ORIENTATION=-
MSTVDFDFRSYRKLNSVNIGSLNKTLSLTGKLECKTIPELSDSDIDDGRRCDYFGTPIAKGGNHRISFPDKIGSQKGKLSQVYEVESFKKFNMDVSLKKNKENTDACCSIF